VTAAYDLATCIENNEVKPYIEATSKLHTLVATKPALGLVRDRSELETLAGRGAYGVSGASRIQKIIFENLQATSHIS
jgi:hypothetical protein